MKDGTTSRGRRLGLRRAIAVIAVVGSCAAEANCLPAQESAPGPKASVRVRLLVPAHAPERPLELAITAGPLPAGASLLVYGADGELLGTVSPFGAQEREHGGIYMLPLNENLRGGTRFAVRCSLKLDATHWRKPTAEELVKSAIVAEPGK